MLRHLLPALCAVLLVGCEVSSQPSFRSTDITGAELARDFALMDHNGEPRTLADFRGKVLAVFFGFAHCPDVCPATLAELAAALRKLGPDAEHVQVAMITVDPERDTPAVLKKYVTALHPGFIGLTGDVAAIQRTAREFKVFYQKSPGATPDSYSIDHFSGVYIFDRQGRVRLLVNYGQGPDVLAHDIGQLLRSNS
jgi:protein SCO1/2